MTYLSESLDERRELLAELRRQLIRSYGPLRRQTALAIRQLEDELGIRGEETER
jgi:hypothetical protein